jgi:UDP-2,3-diacylglucosamine pyrophosphatase LpxH
MSTKTLIFSDVHIGSKGLNHSKFLDMLKSTEYDRIIMVGDIIDGWLFQRYGKFSVEDVKVIRKLLKISAKTEIIWIAGNHDEFLRNFLPTNLGNIKVVDEWVETDVWYIHGDAYDGVMELKWLGRLGSIGYELAIWVDMLFKKMGYKKSVSAWLKSKTKEVVKFITKFENELVRQANKRNVKTVVCGHIHKPEHKFIDGIEYINCGDWIESCSYVEYDGNKFELRKYD